MSNSQITIIGAGPAGLSAAYKALQYGLSPTVFEKSPGVGGIARTESYKSYLFDVGGHRFYTKVEMIHQLWHDILKDEFLEVSRMSRIYYRKKFFHYPLHPLNALSNLGIIESLLIILSYVYSQIRPYPEENTFEQWVSNRFGRRLYKIFFKTYTEKVWGIPCGQIQADWAMQRIKGLSLRVALTNALFGNNTVKSLIDTFHYPVHGPGMMWQQFQNTIEAGGGQILLNTDVISLKHEQGKVVELAYCSDGETRTFPVTQLISSMPLAELIAAFEPKAPDEVREAARHLAYRDFLIVILILSKPDLFPDQWIYIHTPGVKVGRIQNFKNWSAAMVPDIQTTSVGMEYFCQQGDEFWNHTDEELSRLAAKELEEIGLASADDVIDSVILRQPKAYPVYNHDYHIQLQIIRDFLDDFSNLQTIGRNGMHRYDNQDHAMLTGILAAHNILGAQHNLWKVNDDEEYLEEQSDRKVRQLLPENTIIRVFSHLDKLAFGTAVGLIGGLLMLFATLWPVLMNSRELFPYLRLLQQYFFGYTVTVQGAFIAVGYTIFWGFLAGWLFAFFRNVILVLYIYHIKLKTKILSLRDILDYI